MRNLLLCAAACLALAACGPYNLTPDEQGRSELGARDFSERSGGSFISCSGQDSDKDGYVTCSVNVKNGSGQIVETDLLCAYSGTARGCKRKG